MKFEKKDLNLKDGIRKEWVVTNGLGALCSSTIIGANTRRYHGLLVAPLMQPARRYLLISKVDESIEIGNEKFNLYTNGELHGTLDTYKVNQCKSCGHEFEYKEQRYLWSDDYYYGKIDIKLNSYLFLTEISKALDELNNFNPNKLTEECNTIEEKKIQLCKKLKEYYIYVKIMNYPIEVIIYAALQEDFYKSPRCEQIINFGKYKYDFDVHDYLAKLTPQAHDLMVNYLGFKYHFN
jgi:predicted glycogen debranching enzyme